MFSRSGLLTSVTKNLLHFTPVNTVVSPAKRRDRLNYSCAAAALLIKFQPIIFVQTLKAMELHKVYKDIILFAELWVMHKRKRTILRAQLAFVEMVIQD